MNNIPIFNNTNKVLTNIELVGAVVNGKIGVYKLFTPKKQKIK